MATHKIPKGTKNLIVNMPIPMRHRLEELAGKSGVKLSEYVRDVLVAAAAENLLVSERIEVFSLRRGPLKWSISFAQDSEDVTASVDIDELARRPSRESSHSPPVAAPISSELRRIRDAAEASSKQPLPPKRAPKKP